MAQQTQATISRISFNNENINLW